MPQTRVRVVGSGFTTLQWRGNPIAFLDSFTDSGARPIGGNGGGAGWEAITPLAANHPVEIATSRVLGPGTITATIRELWDRPVWQQLQGLGGATNMVQVWRAISEMEAITCQMVIKPPTGAGQTRRKIFHNCVVTGIDDGESVTIGALSVARTIEIVYTHATRENG